MRAATENEIEHIAERVVRHNPEWNDLGNLTNAVTTELLEHDWYPPDSLSAEDAAMNAYIFLRGRV